MNNIALGLPALLLPLFCLIYSVAARRELYFPLPKGISANLRNQHSVFLAMLCALILAAAVSISETVGGPESSGLIKPRRVCALSLRATRKACPLRSPSPEAIRPSAEAIMRLNASAAGL